MQPTDYEPRRAVAEERVHTGRRAAEWPEPGSACPPGASDGRSIGGLFRELTTESSSLIRNEVALAKAEMTEKINTTARNAANIAVGGVVALLGAMFLLWSVTLGTMGLLRLAGVGPEIYAWLGPLIVGLIVAGVGAFLVRKGINTIKNQSLTPQKTARSLQETKEWIKHRTT